VVLVGRNLGDGRWSGRRRGKLGLDLRFGEGISSIGTEE
jgi:hypothetical protein